MSKQRTFPSDVDTADRVQLAIKIADYQVTECSYHPWPNKYSTTVVLVNVGCRTFQVSYPVNGSTANLVREVVPSSLVEVWSR